jgi:hypothetical protein
MSTGGESVLGQADRTGGRVEPVGAVSVDTRPVDAQSSGAPAEAVRAAPVRSDGHISVAQWVLVGAIVATGIILRGWFLYHRPVTSDEAIVGLMGQQILHGHNSAFYWGQYYGGVEQYLIALRYAVFGFSSWALPLVEVLLALGSGLLTWRIARRLVPDAFLAVLAGAVAWAVPEYMMNTLAGFRGVTLFCGLLMILLSLRVLDRQYRAWEFAALGLTAGVGWWSSPEIVYFVVPTAVLLLQSFWADRSEGKAAQWIRHVVMAAVAALVGALPWLWSNARSHLASLSTKTYQPPPGSPDFVGRFRIFFHYSVGMLLNVRDVGTGFWVFPRLLSIGLELVLLAVIAGSVVLCFLARGRALALASGLVAFPFLLAFSPTSWFWQDGRYVGYVVPLYVLVIMMGGVAAARRLTGDRARGGSRRGIGRLLAGSVLTVLVVLTWVNFVKFQIPDQSFFAGWGNPNAATLSVLPKLEASGVRDGFADYWVAYRLDFLSGGKLHLTVVGSDPDRWTTLNQEVLKSRSPAWIFVKPDAAGLTQFGDTVQIEGPASQSQAAFIADLHRLHIGYRIVSTGLVNAVIPDRAVLPQKIGA